MGTNLNMPSGSLDEMKSTRELHRLQMPSKTIIRESAFPMSFSFTSPRRASVLATEPDTHHTMAGSSEQPWSRRPGRPANHAARAA